MAYTALYRKFRPQTFESVIGQEHIVRTLKNQMKTGRVSHAYLFCGTRGTGKTSTAKIFARAINCTNPTADGEPCNECAVCKDILAGRSVNVIEIDAASNNGVDNIREIREEVKYPPTQGKYKVYIIDEVHMLSAAAFNALLKTLEEPPAHVIFILATTDPQKVPATILSRVQRFDFRRITTETIAQTLMGYLKEEGQQATPEAVRYVAHLGDGSMRDSLSILDQCLAFFSGEEVTLEKVLDIMGAVDQTIFFEMTDALAKRDAKEAMLWWSRDAGWERCEAVCDGAFAAPAEPAGGGNAARCDADSGFIRGGRRTAEKGGRSAFSGGADLFHREIFRFAERNEMGNE